MREKASPEDIERVVAALQRLWLTQPQQRLGQLLLNLARDASGNTDKNVLWNLDEDELLKRIARCDWKPQ